MAMTAMVSLSWNPFNVSESDQETASTTMTILMFAMLSIGLLFAMLPSNSSLRDYLFRNHSVLQTTGFTLGLLLFLLFMPANILNSYSYVFVPILLIAGLFAFFKSDGAGTDEKSTTTNSIISLFCALVSFGALMTSDPGGVMSRFVGGPVSLTLLFITLLFSLLYVLSLNITKPVESVGGLIGFALFIFASLVFIAFNRQNLVLVFSMMIPFFLACIVGCSLLTTSSLVASIQTNDSYKRIFFGLYILSMFIVLLCFVIMNAGQSIQYWIINGLILLLLFGTVASIVKGKNNNGHGHGRMSAIGWNIAQYIPCMMTDLMTAIKQQIAATNSGSLLMLLIALALFVVYFLSPSVFNLISNQGGILLLNDPVSLSNSTTLTRTLDQDQDDEEEVEPIYAFAISFWVCMDIVQASNEFYSVLTTGGAPDVEYNPKTHVMRIGMNRGIEGGGIRERMDKGTVLHIDEFPQQAWTHVVININGGLMDVFINGIIRATKTGIVPYYKQNGIVVGSSIYGGICNILYFDHALRSLNVSILYNTHKSSDPPVQSLTNKETTQTNATIIHTSAQL